MGLLISIGACGRDNGSGDPSARLPADDTAPSEPGAVCLLGEPFVAEGVVLGGDAGEPAGRIAALRWERHEGCERFVVELDAEGDDSASAAGARVELLRDLGVVRVTLPGLRTVDPDATDAEFDGPLARAAYVVSAPDGASTYVDLHLREAAEARASVLADPARVVVDLRPGGGPLPPPPAAAQRVVVLEPRPGEASYPLRVVGYARAFEANVVARLEQDDGEVRETFTTATAWVDAWGHFSLTFDDGPGGPVVLHVGEYSARDGAWEGVEIRISADRASRGR